jgi:hypothetical protein
MDQRGASVITYPLALEWAMQPPATRPTWALRFTDARGFSRYMHGRDPRTEILPMRVLAFSSRAKPYLYSETEIARLLEAALALPPAQGLRRWTYYCLFGLLVVTGLRKGEALALRRQDVDLTQGILTIRGAKFGKTRVAPLHRRRATCCVAMSKCATRTLTRLAATTSSSLSAAGSFCINMFGGYSSASPERLVCEARRPPMDLASMTFGIALLCGRSSTGIAPASLSNSCFPYFRPTWVTS